MAQKSTTLASNINVVAIQPAALYQGGRGVLITEATTYPTTCKLQMQSLSGKWLDIATISSDGMQAMDLPAGQYRISMAGGVAAAFYAALVSVAYL